MDQRGIVKDGIENHTRSEKVTGVSIGRVDNSISSKIEIGRATHTEVLK